MQILYVHNLLAYHIYDFILPMLCDALGYHISSHKNGVFVKDIFDVGYR